MEGSMDELSVGKVPEGSAIPSTSGSSGETKTMEPRGWAGNIQHFAEVRKVWATKMVDFFHQYLPLQLWKCLVVPSFWSKVEPL